MVYARFSELKGANLSSYINSEEGFVLIELAVVLAVIAILVSIAIVSMSVLVQRAKITACRANLRSIDRAVAGYYAQYKDYPHSINYLIQFGYLKKEPKEPFTGQRYGLDKNHNAACLNNDRNMGGPHMY